MDVTEVRILLSEDNHNRETRLMAYASMVIDNAMCLRDMRVIDGPDGMFVSMPNRQVTDRCDRCCAKNILKARYCNQCGIRLADNRGMRDERGLVKFFVDLYHPINRETRSQVEDAVLDAFEVKEKQRESTGVAVQS